MKQGKNGKKILIILTGGTIGSVVENGTIGPSGRSTYRLLEAYEQAEQEAGRTVSWQEEFAVEQPYTILSENTTLNTWKELLAFLQKQQMQEYQGIILTHGTDTCSYTAALLGTLYEDLLPVPLVLVSSNYAVGEPGSNGLSNFTHAVSFIRTAGQKGVFCIYEDRFGVSQVMRGTEVTEADTCIDQFGCFGGEPFGRMDGTEFLPNPGHADHCRPALSKEKRQQLLSQGLQTDRTVLLLKAYPGLDFRWIHLPDRAAAVVLYAYHSATLCMEGMTAEANKKDHAELPAAERAQTAFPAFASDCVRQGVPVYVAGFKQHVADIYASARAYERLPIQKLYDVSPEAAYSNVLLTEQLR